VPAVTGVLITLVVLTIVLAGVFLVRPSITAGATGKILAFIGLCVLPALCIGTGMSFHMRRSQQTAYCISCHSMESHGQSLYVLDQNYIPAQHFQNHLVPPNEACYTCHTDYTMYGPLKDKLKGLRYVYMEYVSTPPKTIHLDGKYSNLQCLHCHAGTRDFEANLNLMAPMSSLETNQISCISSGCHATIHNASEVAHLKMWTEGTAPTSIASAAAPAAAGPAAIPGTSKARAGNSARGASAAKGKSVFDSQGCGGCHGEAGGGASGPALTHTQYPPAQLTAVLKAPTAQMKAAGMVPLSVNAADMEALVSYVDGLGDTSAAAAATVPGAGPTSPAPAKARLGAKPGPPNTASAGTPPAAGSSSPATLGPSKAPAGNSASDASAAKGKSVFDSQGCGGCHGEAGGGASGPALTHTSSQYPPAQLTAVLKAPSAQMKAAGMVPLGLNAADMEALVSYVEGLGANSVDSAGTTPPAGSPSPTPAAAGTAAPAGPSKPPTGNSASDASAAKGKSVFDSQGCGGCHGEAGGGASGPALTHTSSQYPPAQLTAVLKAPTAQMKAAGMVPLSVNAADMEALVSYVDGLGGTSAAPAGPVTAAVPSKPVSGKKGVLHRLFAPGGGPIF
jgi:cytochrome c-type protein NapC